MPSSPAAKKLLLVFGLVLAVLALVGLVVGGIGSAALGNSPLISRPEIHLPPQPVFPGASRDKHLGLTPSEAQHQVQGGESPDHASSGTGNAPAGTGEEGEELHAGRCAEGLRVCMGEAHPGAGQSIQMRGCVAGATVAPEGLHPDIVGEDENDAGRSLDPARRRRLLKAFGRESRDDAGEQG